MKNKPRRVLDFINEVQEHITGLVILLASPEVNDPYTFAQRERMSKAMGVLIRESDRALSKALKHGTTKQVC